MIEKFKNLDKEQKRELLRVIGWSGTSLIGGVGGANTAGAEVHFNNRLDNWSFYCIYSFSIPKVLRLFKFLNINL